VLFPWVLFVALLGRAFWCCSSRSRSDNSSGKTTGCIFEVESKTKISSAASKCFVYIVIAIESNVDSMATIRDFYGAPKYPIAPKRWFRDEQHAGSAKSIFRYAFRQFSFWVLFVSQPVRQQRAKTHLKNAFRDAAGAKKVVSRRTTRGQRKVHFQVWLSLVFVLLTTPKTKTNEEHT
jgi:hypothetical protein